MINKSSYFYHGLLKDAVILFGNLFNEIYIEKVIDKEGNKELEKVPFSYGPKSKILSRILMNPNGEIQQNSIKLPRMSFEINGIDFDPLRNTIGVSKVRNSESNQVFSYDTSPYNINFSLYVMSRKSEDCAQIVEQIIPNFSPELEVVYEKDFGHFKKNIRVPFVLEGITTEDDYQGDMTERRSVVWTLSFKAKTMLVSQIADRKVVLDSSVSIFNVKDDNDFGFQEENVAAYIAKWSGDEETEETTLEELRRSDND